MLGVCIGPGPAVASRAMPTTSDQIAVLTDGDVEHFGIRELAGIAGFAWNIGAEQIFVTRGAADRLRLPDEISSTDRDVAHPFAAPRGAWSPYPRGLTPFYIVRHDSGSTVDVGILPWDHAAGLEVAAPADARDALVAFAGAVGRYRWSPGYTGSSIFARGLPQSFAPPPPAEDGGLESDFYWRRDLSKDERARGWIHSYDANGRYLASSSSANLGIGEPFHVDAPTFDHRLAGYWCATIETTSPGLPDPFNPRGLDVVEGDPAFQWWSTSTIELARDLGVLAGVHEAWIYPEGRRRLAGWYKTLAGARTSFLEALRAEDDEIWAALALALVKRTYTISIGSLAGHWRHAPDPLFRPDWRHEIIARARANLYRRLARAPRPPFAVAVDQAFYASAHRDPLAAPPLPISDKLGEFKPAGSAPVPRDVDELSIDRLVGLVGERRP